ncbi:multifunctional methyltransferase subunit TRM112-like protein [Ruditapes philippinarum]|uniref:multifunctional methyltransferase subunit TRM112-like protein n=1 Tax=Ruditapes philippinarum TaxID=129788 RepID=UPI00295C0127|nr:multifunctional methyltransferase subunit TRM112-like protein [Ruditapes philippinarum]
MKLLTHNMLTSNIIKGVSKGFPLGIQASKVEVKSVDFNPEFVARMIPKIDWAALRQAALDVGKCEDLPEDVAPQYEENEDFLKKTHHVLLEVEVIEGELVCPESGRKFPVTNGIPNMLLNEDEV